MSELITTSGQTKNVHWLLLATVSALALTGPASMNAALADASDRPTVWIELGGQLERQIPESPFIPPFLLNGAKPEFEDPSPLEAERAPRYSYGEEGRVVFEPRQSNWVFTAGLRYGRSSNNKRVHQSSKGFSLPFGTGTLPISPVEFADTTASHEESHLVLDFQAGKDVGLGILGPHSESTISIGVRFAQFHSKSSIVISSDPDVTIGRPFPFKYHHTYFGSAITARNFRGTGPSLSFSGSVPLVGDEDDEEISLDFGLNGSLLFGRQKVDVHHETRVTYYNGKIQFRRHAGGRSVISSNQPLDRIQERSLTVPNIGGFAGLSFRYSNAKVSFGYRGDLYFNAMDEGFDSAHSANQSFHGPFATISIGLGG